jgi:16S rRNA (guanine527-N7)-methyltransferase
MTPDIEFVSRETADRLVTFVRLLLDENGRQNLIARSTESEIWDRHIQDSLQLLRHAPPGRWLDIGSGAGLPGMVAAIARPDQEIILVEPRARRAEFLSETAQALGLHNVRVVAAKVQTVEPLTAAIITARAVAALGRLFSIGGRHAGPGCVWLLQKGRNAVAELAEARQSWQGRFDLVPSETDPQAAIVMARDVAPLHRRKGRR